MQAGQRFYNANKILTNQVRAINYKKSRQIMGLGYVNKQCMQIEGID